MPESLAYFPDIARLDAEQYRERVLRIDYSTAMRDMLHYNYSLATLSAQKFALVRRAMRCSKVMFVAFVVVLMTLRVLRP